MSENGSNGAPFVTQLRSRPGVIRLAEPGQGTISLRAQVLEVWDTVRLEVSPSEPPGWNPDAASQRLVRPIAVMKTGITST